MLSIELISQNSKINEYNIAESDGVWHILCLRRGMLTVTLNNVVYDLQENSIVIISPEDFYFVKANESSYYNHFSFKINEMGNENLSSKVLSLGYEEEELLDKMISSDSLSQNQTILQLLLIMCAERFGDIEPLMINKTGVFKKTVVLMERYITSAVTAPEFADMVDVSLSELKRIFARFSGIGIHDYFLMLKIKKAMKLLQEGSSITYTANVLRFSSQPYFSTTFKRIVGISAKSYSMDKLFGGKKSRIKGGYKQSKPTAKISSSLPDYLL